MPLYNTQSIQDQKLKSRQRRWSRSSARYPAVYRRVCSHGGWWKKWKLRYPSKHYIQILSSSIAHLTWIHDYWYGSHGFINPAFGLNIRKARWEQELRLVSRPYTMIFQGDLSTSSSLHLWERLKTQRIMGKDLDSILNELEMCVQASRMLQHS